jgi:hypothetical protein
MRPIAEQNPTGKEPAEKPVCPEKGIQDVAAVVAYICDAGVGKVAIPLVLDAGDLAVLVEDVDLAGDGRLFADALDLVHCRHVQLDGVAGGGDAVVFALDFGESGLEAVLWEIISKMFEIP